MGKRGNILYELFGSPSSSTKKIYYGALVTVGLYVLGPTVTSLIQRLVTGKHQEVSDGRVDRVTTGLENRANDCYANSSLQSLASSETLAQYLRNFLADVSEDQMDEEESKSTTTYVKFPMHVALAGLLDKLREPLNSARTLTAQRIKQVAQLLQGSNLRNTQQDAHEFTQMILDSLYEEYKSRESPLTFPFRGTTGTQLVCLTCHNTSEMQRQDFMIYEAVAPQSYSADLASILSQEQTTVIDGYKCLRCVLFRLLENERRLGPRPNMSQFERDTLHHLESVHTTLYINSDLAGPIHDYIRQYSRGGCAPYTMPSQVHKRTVITSMPLVLLIHLSRSVFSGSGSSVRNDCRVSYPASLDVPVPGLEQPGKYHLCSLTKHTGTHHRGHYQAYRHKPDLVKDRATGQVVNRSVRIGTQPPTAQGTKYKRIRSVVQRPFWKICDSSVSEASEATVLGETKYVYMLYYEAGAMK